MKIMLFVVLLIATNVSNGQYPDIYKFPQIQQHKTNYFIDTVTRKLYEIQSIDSSIKAGTGVAFVRDSVTRDTAYHLVFLIVPLEETDFYRKMMGQPFPWMFFVSDIDGQTITSKKGKIILINFWSTTCGPCIAEMPYLNRMVDSLRNGPFEFVAFTQDSLKKVKKFLLTHPFKYNVVVSSFADELGIRAYPTHIIIDASGKVIGILEGVNINPVTRKLLIRQEIDSVLSLSSKAMQ
jgi:thiol-disulfide isomerase/thioredoxin